MGVAFFVLDETLCRHCQNQLPTHSTTTLCAYCHKDQFDATDLECEEMRVEEKYMLLLAYRGIMRGELP
jgi:predicted amidophosphoribosyltransferase